MERLFLRTTLRSQGLPDPAINNDPYPELVQLPLESACSKAENGSNDAWETAGLFASKIYWNYASSLGGSRRGGAGRANGRTCFSLRSGGFFFSKCDTLRSGTGLSAGVTACAGLTGRVLLPGNFWSVDIRSPIRVCQARLPSSTCSLSRYTRCNCM